VTNDPNLPPIISTVAWTDAGEGTMVAHINVLGVDMHLEAIEVDEVGVPVNREHADRLTTLQAHEDGSFRTIELVEGRRFILLAVPFCE
jgi:hypothetical protein